MSEAPYLARAQALRSELIEVRNDLHRHPELAFAEHRTAEKGRAWLQALGLDVVAGVAGTTGVLATLDTGRPGPTIILRGDMDALPIAEATGAAYASTNPGVMHACGHDVHTTCVLGAAKVLSEQREHLRGRVRFILQPAEEAPPGGALGLIEQGGILDGVDAALALHVHPRIPVGQIGFRAGTLLANSDRFTVQIKGVGGHAARPHETVDAVAVAVQVYQALQYLVSRENDPFHPFVITVGALNAGTASNVIPETATLQGTVRTLDDNVQASMHERIERLVGGICQATRADYVLDYTTGYPSLVNDEALTVQAIASVRGMLGDAAIFQIPRPEMGGEDFAYFAKRVPATMIRLGTGNIARGLVHPVHHPRFDIDEDALPLGVAALCRISADYLKGG